MTIKLMLTTSEPTAVNKTVVEVASYDGTMRGDCSLIDPVFTLQIPFVRINIAQCNYIYIPDFKRYYFITAMKAINPDLWQITCHVDVLYTYRDYIKALPALVSRKTAAADDAYIADNKVVLYSSPDVVTKNFPASFTDKQYLLTLIGID